MQRAFALVPPNRGGVRVRVERDETRDVEIEIAEPLPIDRAHAYTRSVVGPRLLVLLALSLAGCACGAEDGLLVDLRTDLVPDVEFRAVRIDVFGGARTDGTPLRSEDAAVLTTHDYVRGRRVAELPGLARGDLMVRTRLLDARETVVAERLAQVTLEGRYVLTVLVTRDCRGVTCPGAGDSPDAVTCLGGTCGAADCILGTEPSCEPECDSDADCDGFAACAIADSMP